MRGRVREGAVVPFCRIHSRHHRLGFPTMDRGRPARARSSSRRGHRVGEEAEGAAGEGDREEGAGAEEGEEAIEMGEEEEEEEQGEGEREEEEEMDFSSLLSWKIRGGTCCRGARHKLRRFCRLHIFRRQRKRTGALYGGGRPWL